MVKSKLIVLIILVFSSLHANEEFKLNKVERELIKQSSCSEIIKELQLLEKEKSDEFIANIVAKVVFFINWYVFGETDKTLDERIQVLKLQLSSCQKQDDIIRKTRGLP